MQPPGYEISIDDKARGFWIQLEDDSCSIGQYHVGYFITGTIEPIQGGEVERNISYAPVYTGAKRFLWEGFFKGGRLFRITLRCLTTEGISSIGEEKVLTTELGNRSSLPRSSLPRSSTFWCENTYLLSLLRLVTTMLFNSSTKMTAVNQILFFRYRSLLFLLFQQHINNNALYQYMILLKNIIPIQK